MHNDTTELEPPGIVPLTAWATVAAGTLSACGGSEGDGDGVSLPQAFAEVGPNTPRRQILGIAPPAASAASASAPVPSPSELMNWAEKAYSQFFPGPQSDQALPPYTYRHYPATGNYLGTANGRVYILGPVAGGGPDVVDVGAIADFASRVAALSFPGRRRDGRALSRPGHAGRHRRRHRRGAHPGLRRLAARRVCQGARARATGSSCWTRALPTTPTTATRRWAVTRRCGSA